MTKGPVRQHHTLATTGKVPGCGATPKSNKAAAKRGGSMKKSKGGKC